LRIISKRLLKPFFFLSLAVKNFQVAILLAFLSQISAQNPCAGVWGGRVPHPTDCSKYYNCVLTIRIQQSCGTNEIFDAASLSCIRGDPSTCEPFVETTPTVAPPPSNTTIPQETTTPPPSIGEICSNVFFAARPHPTSETLYVGCMRGDGLIFQCLSNEIFDRRINECIVECRVNANVCAGFKLDLIAHPCSCYRYIICYNEAIVDDVECGPNEIFSPEDNE
jgi:hypothetical protein